MAGCNTSFQSHRGGRAGRGAGAAGPAGRAPPDESCEERKFGLGGKSSAVCGHGDGRVVGGAGAAHENAVVAAGAREGVDWLGRGGAAMEMKSNRAGKKEYIR